MRQFPRFVAVVALGGATACQSAAPRATSQAPTPASQSAASGTDYDAIVRARTDSMRRRFTPADVRFMTGMIGHHAQALVMSAYAPTNEASTGVRTLASRIINAQKDEIALMQAWLRDRGQPVPAVPSVGAAAAPAATMSHDMAGMNHDMSGHALMPGMLTDAQLAQLGAAHGDEFDRLFLMFMIQHHKGAVSMVLDLFKTDGAAQDELVFKFASDVQVDQSTEIARMQRMLALTPTR